MCAGLEFRNGGVGFPKKDAVHIIETIRKNTTRISEMTFSTCNEFLGHIRVVCDLHSHDLPHYEHYVKVLDDGQQCTKNQVRSTAPLHCVPRHIVCVQITARALRACLCAAVCGFRDRDLRRPERRAE